MNGSNMSPSLILNVLESQIFQYNFLEGNSQGSYRSWKTWKVMEFYDFVFQAWKVMEFRGGSWKVMENDVDCTK